jgi:hypothetical protein
MKKRKIIVEWAWANVDADQFICMVEVAAATLGFSSLWISVNALNLGFHSSVCGL